MSDENSHLLRDSYRTRHRHARVKVGVIVFSFLALTAVVVGLGLAGKLPGIDGPLEKGPEDAYERALWLLDRSVTTSSA